MSRSRNFTFTKNNYTEEDITSLSELKCRYLVFGREVAPTTLTPHLQGYIVFDLQKTIPAAAKCLLNSHVEVAKGTHLQASEYCKKDGLFTETGLLPSQGNRTDLGEIAKTILTKRPMVEIANEAPDLYIRYHKGMLALRAVSLSVTEDRPELMNYWYYGSTGVGKSRRVREEHPSLYLKGLNKWWDNYDGETTVLLDDFAPEHGKYLAGYLKQWTDHYAFSAEFKGGSIKIRPPVVIVTSNYSLEECFENGADIAALKRRFKICNMDRPASQYADTFIPPVNKENK